MEPGDSGLGSGDRGMDAAAAWWALNDDDKKGGCCGLTCVLLAVGALWLVRLARGVF